MDLGLWYLQTSKEPWLTEAQQVYTKKLQGFTKFELVALKSPNLARGQQAQKSEVESELILKKLSGKERLILFDEKAWKPKSSVELSQKLVSEFEGAASKFVFVIGGAFGFSDALKAKANLRISLSNLTMNHHVAQLMALEQLYRAFSIWKGLPYHNE